MMGLMYFVLWWLGLLPSADHVGDPEWQAAMQAAANLQQQKQLEQQQQQLEGELLG